MDWKYYCKIILSMFFLLCLVVIGTNISANQLVVATNWDIKPPFMLTSFESNIICLDVLGDSYQYSIEPVLKSYSSVKSSIQNSWGTVKFNLAPRADYLLQHWGQGIEKLRQDLSKAGKDFN
ncbi:MAG: hypothetical protein VR72_03400 [Clostridiaceae bacterium BRH_c20a]|nr:MAG: hypothetical protein VR72_03400 [Clostridiaceae bacterium BRH_c20a]